MTEAHAHDGQQRTQAVTKKSRWPGWIWAVPIAAIAITGWLLAREFLTGGVGVTIVFDQAAGMTAKDTKVKLRGLDIGEVSAVGLATDGSHVTADVNINDSAKKYLVSGTKFYLEGQPSFSNPSSLKSIISGPTIEMVPGSGSATRHFSGIDGMPPPQLAAAVPYVAMFDGDVGDVPVGSAVTLRGFTVGRVDGVRLTINPQNGQLITPVKISLDPTRLDPGVQAPADGNWAEPLNATLSKLIAKGLRAQLTQDPPVIGSRHVTLDILPGVQPAALSVRPDVTEIPTQSGGGIGGIVDQIGQLPIAQIGNEVQAIAAQAHALVSAPQIMDTLDHLDQTVAQLDKTMAAAGPKIPPMVESARRTVDQLRETASKIDATAAAMKSMMGGSPAAPNGNLQQALNELSQAGRAVRSLADDLDQHPESIIKGRGGSK